MKYLARLQRRIPILLTQTHPNFLGVKIKWKNDELAHYFSSIGFVFEVTFDNYSSNDIASNFI